MGCVGAAREDLDWRLDRRGEGSWSCRQETLGCGAPSASRALALCPPVAHGRLHGEQLTTIRGRGSSGSQKGYLLVK